MEWGELRERGRREQGRDRAREGGGGGEAPYSVTVLLYVCIYVMLVQNLSEGMVYNKALLLMLYDQLVLT